MENNFVFEPFETDNSTNVTSSNGLDNVWWKHVIEDIAAKEATFYANECYKYDCWASKGNPTRRRNKLYPRRNSFVVSFNSGPRPRKRHCYVD